MASSSAYNSEKSECLSDSWLEVNCDKNEKSEGKTVLDMSINVMDPTASYTDSIEKLLIDAQCESATPSRPNSDVSSERSSILSGCSPKSPETPNSEWSNEEWQLKQDPGTDWIWDWSSRPEVQQSFEKLSERFRHPGSKPWRAPFSVRNTQVLKKTRLFSWVNLPTLFLTHACSFFLGAAVFFIYFKKYCRYSGIAQVALD